MFTEQEKKIDKEILFASGCSDSIFSNGFTDWLCMDTFCYD